MAQSMSSMHGLGNAATGSVCVPKEAVDAVATRRSSQRTRQQARLCHSVAFTQSTKTQAKEVRG